MAPLPHYRAYGSVARRIGGLLAASAASPCNSSVANMPWWKVPRIYPGPVAAGSSPRSAAVPSTSRGSEEHINGPCGQCVQLLSGKNPLVERSRECSLVSWRPVIEKELGRWVSGLVRDDGISWELGRNRRARIGV
jgi:hypothetical protein